MMKSKLNSADLILSDLGSSPPAVAVPADTDGKRAKVLGWFAVAITGIGLIGAVSLMWAGNITQTLEATVRMERLAAKMEHAKSLDLTTASYIERVISQPSYNCNQVTCSKTLEARNRAARNRLRTLMAAKVQDQRIVDTKPTIDQETEAMTTGSAGDSVRK